jgi:hypothetical protein
MYHLSSIIYPLSSILYDVTHVSTPLFLQVGINKRLMVFNPEGDPKKWPKEVVLVNPKIVGQSEATDVEPEGCLSFPGVNPKLSIMEPEA